MGTIHCPYCDIEVNENAIEGNDGCCPECGAAIGRGSIYTDDYEDDDEYDYDDDEYDFDDDLEDDLDFDDDELDLDEDFDEDFEDDYEDDEE